MLCFKCGKEIDDGSKFCPHCGAVVSGGSAPADPGPGAGGTGGAPSLEGGGKKRAGKGLVIGGIAAAVAVVVLAAAALSGLFSSPKGQVEKAFAKTAAAYAEAGRKLELPDLGGLREGRSATQRYSVEVNSVNSGLAGGDLSALKGLGLRVATDVDWEGREMDCEMAAFWGSEDLAVFQMLVEDSVASMGSPQFTKGAFYGVDTETLGVDLDRLGVEDGSVDVKSISFNLFDLMEALIPSGEQAQETERLVRQAGKDLLDGIKVDKTGKETIQVNGSGVGAEAYRVTVPQEVMEDYIDAMEQAMEQADGQDGLREVLRSMGVPEDELDALLAGTEGGSPYGGMAGSLRRLAEEQGGLELDVYASGGYVSAVVYEGQAGGQTQKAGLYLGGGGNYVDDLSLEVEADGVTITVESTGDHGAAGGVFTDKTIIRGGNDRITSTLRYDPKGGDGGFAWEITLPGAVSLELEGEIAAGKDCVELKQGEVRVKAAGMEVCALGLEYYMGPCEGMRVSAPAPRMLGDMDMEQLMELYDDIQDNAEEWAYGMIALIPPDLLWYLL